MKLRRKPPPFTILPQPDATTCGPACLHAVYRYFGEDLPLSSVIRETESLEEGGTLAVRLGCHALRWGYRASRYSWNLQVFDPTWRRLASLKALAGKRRVQARIKKDAKLRTATKGYLEFLRLGGRIRFEDLTASLLRRRRNRGVPVLAGLSSTYLYQSPRESNEEEKEDDVGGYPQGHFVVLCGYDRKAKKVLVADPLHPNPVSKSPLYGVPIRRLLAAIFLGIVTFDANLLALEPPGRARRP